MTIENELVYSEQTQTFTTWKNNNNVAATFRLLTHEKRKGRQNINHQNNGDCLMSVFLKVVVQPGEQIRLPSEYDSAIRKVSERTGEVVGGLCPWLTKVGEEDIVINKSLDYKIAIMEEQAQNTIDALKKENQLRSALDEIEKAKAALAAKELSLKTKK
jgi:hypothetical protein